MFNKASRTNNAMKATTVGLANQIISLVLAFIFRTAFIKILSEEYLGLNGLFSSILGILSLAELGIGAAIVFRLYAPVAIEDIDKISALLDFYKKVYRIVMVVIAVAGLCTMPFVKFFISKDSVIPEDINVYLVFGLFLLQTISSYFFVHKQGILQADQRGYQLSLIAIMTNALRYGLQLLVLFLTKNYVYTLVTAIAVNFLFNAIVAVGVTRQYREVFNNKTKLKKSERKIILKDTYALLCHRVGGTILNSTDAILISSFIGLAIGGIYSNYVMIIVAVTAISTQLLTSYVSSLGNLKVTSDGENEYVVYKRLLFMNFAISSFCFTCLFTLFNPFVEAWLGVKYSLNIFVVLLICTNFFIASNKSINNSFVAATGLFVRDKIRPFIEAGINLVTSIGLVVLFGNEELFAGVYEFLGANGKENFQLIGIFLGTVVSTLSVAVWREVYLLYKHEFEKPQWDFYRRYLYFVLITGVASVAGYYSTKYLPNGWGYFLIKALIVMTIYGLVFVLLNFKSKDFKFYMNFIKRVLVNILVKLKLIKKRKNIVNKAEGSPPSEQIVSLDNDTIEKCQADENKVLEDKTNKNDKGKEDV